MKEGYKTLVKIDNQLVAGQVDSGLSTETEMLNVHAGLTKGVEVRPVRTSASATVTINYTDSVYSLLIAKQINGNPVTLYYGGTSAGDKYWMATCYIRSIGRTDPSAGISTISLELTVSGDIVEQTV